MPDVAMQKVWLLYWKSCGCIERPVDLLTFRRDVVRVYLIKYSRQQPLYSMPCPPALCGRSAAEVIRYDERSHYPGRELRQRACHHCVKRATVMCVKCQAILHIHCFEAFHEKWWKATWNQWIGKAPHHIRIIASVYHLQWYSLYLLNGIMQ